MKKIMITAPVHQDAKIFREYLWSLNRLEIPEGYIVDKYFYLHNADNLKKFLQSNEYEIFKDDTKVEQNDITHIWKTENFSAVAQMRTKALERARELEYDYIFSVDSDVILHKESLIDLINEQKDAIAKIYWTAWDSNQPWNLMPNCYDGRKKNGQIFYFRNIENYKIIGTYPTEITGAAILISSKIFNKTEINYYPIDLLSQSYWEDLAFCTRCKCVIPDLQFYINTLHPAKHLYRKEDCDKWIKWEKDLWEKEF